jgi:2',3'-cyclic-nucleotide 2'-phosphodiesterase (5'-nucleotidase family)
MFIRLRRICSEVIRLLRYFLLVWVVVGCASDNHSLLTIVYDNDVHCAVDGYSKVKSLSDSLMKSSLCLEVVSCGDFVQGDVLGSATHGKAIVDIMNMVGYGVAIPGNHEFDYGVERLMALSDTLNGTVLCSNFYDICVNEPLFAPYKVIDYGTVSVAYLGVTTTATPTSVIPKTFQDDTGNLKYHFCFDSLYVNTQKYIYQARAEGADYVVVLSHLGDIENGEHPTSRDLISNISGVDVIIDGHAHSTIECEYACDKVGKRVLLTSSGTRFENVGIVRLDKRGVFTSELIPTIEIATDSILGSYIEQLRASAISVGERVVAFNESLLPIETPDGSIIVRREECGMANLCTDALRVELGTDIAILNGGGFRNGLEKGQITYNNLYSVLPYNNQLSKAAIVGRELLDVLEFSASYLPNEDGNFLQVSGLRFSIDSTIPSPVMMDVDGMFSFVGEGTRRVSNVEVWDKESGEYRRLNPEQEYTLTSIDFLLKHNGGSGILRSAKPVQDGLGQDVDIVEQFIKTHLGGTIPASYAQPQGRINIQ